jgi:hypothetical protein
VGSVDPHLAVGSNPKERGQGSATCSHNEFSDASLHVTMTVGVQRSEALIVVIMAAQDHVYTVGVKNSPERIQAWIVAMPTRTKSGMVEKRQRAYCGMALEIRGEPLLLAGFERPVENVAVQSNDVPRAKLEAIEAFAGHPRPLAPVGVVRRRAGRIVLVVPRRRPGAILEPTPGRVIALPKLPFCPIRVRQVAEGQYSSRDAAYEARGRLGASLNVS